MIDINVFWQELGIMKITDSNDIQFALAHAANEYSKDSKTDLKLKK